MAKSPEEMAESMIANLPDKTGKSLDQWLELLRPSGLAKHGEIVKHLKADHGLTHGYANLIAHKALASDAGSAGSTDDLVDAQYAGAKAGLRPLYEAVLKAATQFGSDVEVSPKKTYVSLRRNQQFAILKPSTKTRLDVGLNLKQEPTTDRLRPAKAVGSMCSHEVAVTEAKEIDRELVGWMKKAYERS